MAVATTTSPVRPAKGRRKYQSPSCRSSSRRARLAVAGSSAAKASRDQEDDGPRKSPMVVVAVGSRFMLCRKDDSGVMGSDGDHRADVEALISRSFHCTYEDHAIQACPSHWRGWCDKPIGNLETPRSGAAAAILFMQPCFQVPVTEQGVRLAHLHARLPYVWTYI